MREDRRAFLGRVLFGAVFGASRRLRGLTAAAGAIASRRAGAAASEVPDLHRETRNRLLGPIGPRGSEIPGKNRRFKPYRGLKRQPLPSETPPPAVTLEAVLRAWKPHDLAPGSLPLRLLSQLLLSTNGVTGTEHFDGDVLQLRSAPSAGALYAGEVYVVSSDVEGLPPGAWYYDVIRHELVELRRGALHERIEAALERPGRVHDAAAVVLLSNVFSRYRTRYANRGYRYALIDSGHIGENLRLAASAAGWASLELPDFCDDLLNGLLGLDGRAEAVCAVHALGAPAEAGTAPPRVRSLAEKRRAGGNSDVVEAWHEATKLEPVRNAVDRARPKLPSSSATQSALSLPRVEPGSSMSLARSIRTRRSAMRFSRDPMRLADLSFALEMARGTPALARAPGVDLHVVAHRVEGVVPGHYRYEPAMHRLALLREGSLEGPMVRACLDQQKAGDAAAGCVMVAQLGEAGVLARARSYRDLLIDAGASAERIYLAAESRGIAARNLAAYRDRALNGLLGLDGLSQAAIHLTMLGPGD